MAHKEKVKTRFLILSDTHSTLPGRGSNEVYYQNPLPAADVAIHCGDLTMTGKPTEHRKALELLRSIEAEVKIVIPGNHDLTLDQAYCQTHPKLYGWNREHTEDDLESAKEFYSVKVVREAGISYLEEGTRTFYLKNGAELNIYASGYTPEFCDWGFAYPRSEDRFNLKTAQNPVPDFDGSGETQNIDIMITHGPPKDVLDMTTRNIPAGCEHLKEAVARCRPLVHCFGHIHEGWGAVHTSWSNEVKGDNLQSQLQVLLDKNQMIRHMAAYYDGTIMRHGQETLFVNASIMDVHYRPSQAPWIVDLLLNKSEAGTIPL